MRLLGFAAALLTALSARAAGADTTACITNPGSVLLDSGATLNLEIVGTAKCSGYTSFAVGQTLTIQHATLNVTLGNGFVPSVGQGFQLLSWNKLVGQFGTVNLPPLGTGAAWDTSQLYTTGGVSAVSAPTVSSSATDGPLPAWALGALGAGFLGIAARRLSRPS